MQHCSRTVCSARHTTLILAITTTVQSTPRTGPSASQCCTSQVLHLCSCLSDKISVTAAKHCEEPESSDQNQSEEEASQATVSAVQSSEEVATDSELICSPWQRQLASRHSPPLSAVAIIVLRGDHSPGRGGPGGHSSSRLGGQRGRSCWTRAGQPPRMNFARRRLFGLRHSSNTSSNGEQFIPCSAVHGMA